MSVRKFLLQLDSDETAGVFDAVMAYDAGVDCVHPVGNVSPPEAQRMARDLIFARSREDLSSLAIFVGGSDLTAGLEILAAVQAAFCGPMRVAVMLDSNGCNTTAAAVVAKILGVGPVGGQRVVVLAGTGPVGQRIAALLAREGARVTITSRQLTKARRATGSIKQRFAVPVGAAEARDAEGVCRALHGADMVITAGAPGVMLLPEVIWCEHPSIRLLADANAVPPLGIEGIDASWEGEQRAGKTIFGALAIGALKKAVHYACLARLFERNDLVLDAEEIHLLAQEIEGRRLKERSHQGRGLCTPC